MQISATKRLELVLNGYEVESLRLLSLLAKARLLDIPHVTCRGGVPKQGTLVGNDITNINYLINEICEYTDKSEHYDIEAVNNQTTLTTKE